MSEQTPLSREDLELVERMMIAQVAHWADRNEGKRYDAMWDAAERCVRARPAHLDPGRRQAETQAAINEVLRKVQEGSGPGFGFVTIKPLGCESKP